MICAAVPPGPGVTDGRLRVVCDSSKDLGKKETCSGTQELKYGRDTESVGYQSSKGSIENRRGPSRHELNQFEAAVEEVP